MKDKRDDPEKVQQILDYGWEQGCFAPPFATFNDILSDSESNAQVSEYIRQKIRSTVHDPETAELLCPTYPLGAKRFPIGTFYYEAFNRYNVRLVDISQDEIDLYEKGIRTGTGTEYEFDIIIFALRFDAGIGALNAIDINGSQGKSLRATWEENLKGVSTFVRILISHFLNMFIVCGPHIPIGNVPVVLDVAVD
ncbi:uncharacterized protein BDV14DRAFT_196982 [Aspergillus stella-maris]|uniref:uncharacterized protein n=1 Tax=Aspergillus stella-maris TaxID=1810926 RepID=UPI003CCE1B4C